MSKKKSKRPEIGKKSVNPFERFDPKKTAKEQTFERQRNKSRFIKKFRDSDLVYERTSKKSRKLQLYNLNEPITLTHKNRPIEENYDSDLERSSEDDLDLRGDFSNLEETYQEYKTLKEQSRRDKEGQKSLLAKLDKEFEGLDLAQFYKPAKNTLEFFKTQEKPRKLDAYESSLKELQLNREAPGPSLDLSRDYRSAPNIAKRLEVVYRILKSDLSTPGFVQHYVTGCLDSLEEYLQEGDHGNFASHLDLFAKGLLHLSSLNHKECKSHLEDELEKIGTQPGDTRKYLLLALVGKTVEPNTELYKHTFLLLEQYLIELHRRLLARQTLDRELAVPVRILLLVSYNAILETGYYIAHFYHLSTHLCTIPNLGADFVLLILKLIKTTLNVLLQKQCNLNSLLSLVIVPALDRIEPRFSQGSDSQQVTGSSTDSSTSSSKVINVTQEQFAQFVAFKEYVHRLRGLKHTPKSLDIYNKQKVKVEFPKLKAPKFGDNTRPSRDKGDSYSRKGDRRDRAEYKNLKRLLLDESLRRAEYKSQKRSKQRLETERRYKEVVRNAMVEQDMLKKLATTSI